MSGGAAGDPQGCPNFHISEMLVHTQCSKISKPPRTHRSKIVISTLICY